MTECELNELCGQIIGACIDVHKSLGPGLLENIYADCLAYELELRKLRYRREVVIPFIYKGREFSTRLKADMIVENAIILELKSVAELTTLYEAQLMTYLTLSGIELGLLINFNVPLLKDGITRMRINHGKMSKSDVDLLTKFHRDR